MCFVRLHLTKLLNIKVKFFQIVISRVTYFQQSGQNLALLATVHIC